ncbi:MAG: hypothetical protein AAGJ08_26190 [Cyanobacteria bacterium P01_H01_bin.35]
MVKQNTEGLKKYHWKNNRPPKNFLTASYLKELGLKAVKPVGVIQVGISQLYNVRLYDINRIDSVEAEKGTILEEARLISNYIIDLQDYINQWDYDSAYNESVESAKKIVKNKEEFVILGMKTTTLNTKNEIVELAITDLDGNTFINTLVRPSSNAQEILEGKPTFAQVYPKIMEITQHKHICVYNRQLNFTILKRTVHKYGFPQLNYSSGICIMLMHNEYCNKWDNTNKCWENQSFNGGSQALEDCLATERLVKKMAESEYRTPPDAYYQLNKTGTQAKTATTLMGMVKEIFPQLKE